MVVDIDAELRKSAGRGETAAVKRLIADGADVESANGFGWTSLHSAAFKGHVETVEVLLQAGANPSATDKENFTPLQMAGEQGHVEIIDILSEAEALASQDRNSSSRSPSTPSGRMSRFSDGLSVAKKLLQRISSPSARNSSDVSPDSHGKHVTWADNIAQVREFEKQEDDHGPPPPLPQRRGKKERQEGRGQQPNGSSNGGGSDADVQTRHLKAALEAKDAELKELREKMSTEEMERLTEREVMEQMIVSLNVEVEELKVQVQGWKDAAESRNDGELAEHQRTKDELVECRKEMEVVRGEREELESDNERLRTRVKALEDGMEAAKKENVSLQIASQEAKTSLLAERSLRSRLEEKASELSDLLEEEKKSSAQVQRKLSHVMGTDAGVEGEGPESGEGLAVGALQQRSYLYLGERLNEVVMDNGKLKETVEFLQETIHTLNEELVQKKLIIQEFIRRDKLERLHRGNSASSLDSTDTVSPTTSHPQGQKNSSAAVGPFPLLKRTSSADSASSSSMDGGGGSSGGKMSSKLKGFAFGVGKGVGKGVGIVGKGVDIVGKGVVSQLGVKTPAQRKADESALLSDASQGLVEKVILENIELQKEIATLRAASSADEKQQERKADVSAASTTEGQPAAENN